MPSKIILAAISVASTLTISAISMDMFRKPVIRQNDNQVVSRVVSDPMYCTVAQQRINYDPEIYCK